MKNDLAKKLRKKTSILSDAEVKIVTREIRRILGREFFARIKGSHVRMGDTVRWSSLRARCEEAREKRGVTLKEVSSELKIPQYRLRAVEQGSFSELKPEFVHRYFQYLGIESWVTRWARGNADLARRSGIRPLPRGARGAMVEKNRNGNLTKSSTRRSGRSRSVRD